jgi:Ran GTPase-activating protein (RanGAP) involved in mRNA processing and transport
MQVQDLYYKKYLKYKNKYLNLLKQIGGDSIKIKGINIDKITSTLDFTNEKLTDEEFTLLIAILPKLQNLTNLTLTNSGINSERAIALAEVLKNNKILTTLILNNNTDIGDEGAYAIASILNTLQNLFTLDLTNCGISKEQIDIISEILYYLTTSLKTIKGISNIYVDY